MSRNTEISPCKKFRYTLWRTWGASSRYLNIIGLNPSTADATLDDPTIRRCVDFAKRLGFDALCMTNLFAFRATKPKAMMAARDPVGPYNDAWLRHCAESAGMVICAWGGHGSHLERSKAVAAILKPLARLYALQVNADGSPKHPLYIPAATKPKLFTIA